MMDAIKLMLSGIMLMLIAIFLIFCEAGNFCMFLSVIGVILFVIGVFQKVNDTPMALDELPQKTCANCGKEYDFDYATCPYCGHSQTKE